MSSLSLELAPAINPTDVGLLELLTNGTFSSSIDGWQAWTEVANTATAQWTADGLELTPDGFSGYSQAVSLDVGIVYEIVLTVATGSNNGRVYVNNNDNASTPIVNASFLTPGEHTIEFTATDASMYLLLSASTSGQVVTYGSVSLKKK